MIPPESGLYSIRGDLKSLAVSNTQFMIVNCPWLSEYKTTFPSNPAEYSWFL